MPDYIVTRSTGWPIENPTSKLHAVIELSEDDAKAGIAAGYLVPADPNHPQFKVVASTFTPILQAHAATKAETKKAATAPEPEPLSEKPEIEPAKK